MKKAKIAFWGILVCFLALIFFSNKDYFLAKQALNLKLPFLEPYHAPELATAFFFLVFFLSGFLIAYFFSLYDRFKCKKTIKELSAAAATQFEEISSLKSEVESLKGKPADSDAEQNGAVHEEQSE